MWQKIKNNAHIIEHVFWVIWSVVVFAMFSYGYFYFMTGGDLSEKTYFTRAGIRHGNPDLDYWFYSILFVLGLLLRFIIKFQKERQSRFTYIVIGTFTWLSIMFYLVYSETIINSAILFQMIALCVVAWRILKITNPEALKQFHNAPIDLEIPSNIVQKPKKKRLNRKHGRN